MYPFIYQRTNRYIHIIAAVLMLFVAIGNPVTASAQSKTFKKTWTKLLSPMYYQCATPTDGQPNGQTTFRIFGFDKDTEYQADFLAEGNVTETRKGDKEYLFSISDGVFVLDQNEVILKYEGSYAMGVMYNKSTKKTQISVLFVEGKLSYQDKTCVIDKTWSKELGMIKIYVDEKCNAKPLMKIDMSKFVAPNVYTRYQSATPNKIFLTAILYGNAGLTGKDSVFVYSLLPEDGSITALPKYQEQYRYVKIKNDEKSREKIGYSMGSEIKLPGVQASLYSDKITIEVSGHPTLKPLSAVCNIVNGQCELKSVKWSNERSKYEDGTMTRSDGSKLTGINISQTNHAERGAIINALEMLQCLTDDMTTDYSSFTERYGIAIPTYISPDGTSEQLVDGHILSVENARKALSDEEAVWGPKGYIEMNQLKVGGVVDGVYINYDAKYLDEWRYLTVVGEITPHALVPREAFFNVKIFDPAGDLIIDNEFEPEYTYTAKCSIQSDMDCLNFGTYDLVSVMPGKYRIEVWHDSVKLGTTQMTAMRPPSAAYLTALNPRYNYTYYGNRGLYVTFGIETVSLKGQELTVSMKFYHKNGKAATFQGKPVAHSYKITPSYENTTYSNQEFFFSNSWMHDGLGSKYGELEYRIEIRTKAGKLLDSRKGTINWH